MVARNFRKRDSSASGGSIALYSMAVFVVFSTGRPKLTQNNLCKPQAVEVGLAFEAVESFMDDDLNGSHFIVGQLLKLAFAPLAA